ncbi:hypothetical protein GE21DRAFT_1068833 [Neurospora crassa]|nr:hypothetical protein GE21DRAFT_1068833 [Neurospora crassa]
MERFTPRVPFFLLSPLQPVEGWERIGRQSFLDPGRYPVGKSRLLGGQAENDRLDTYMSQLSSVNLSQAFLLIYLLSLVPSSSFLSLRSPSPPELSATNPVQPCPAHPLVLTLSSCIESTSSSCEFDPDGTNGVFNSFRGYCARNLELP